MLMCTFVNLSQCDFIHFTQYYQVIFIHLSQFIHPLHFHFPLSERSNIHMVSLLFHVDMGAHSCLDQFFWAQTFQYLNLYSASPPLQEAQVSCRGTQLHAKFLVFILNCETNLCTIRFIDLGKFHVNRNVSLRLSNVGLRFFRSLTSAIYFIQQQDLELQKIKLRDSASPQ